MLLVDTNVLLDVLEDDPPWADWLVRQLRDQAQVHEPLINPVIYAELSLAFDSVDATDAAIERMEIVVRELPRRARILVASIAPILRAVIEERHGTIRTSIQGQSGGAIVTAGERVAGRGRERDGHWAGDFAALA